MDLVNQPAPVNLFEYQDYRTFLRDWYAAQKRRLAHFSHRSFAQKAGFRTSNFFLLVMKGKRNLTEQSLSKFIHGLGLNKQEQEFFRNLVFLNQARTTQDKDRYFLRLIQSRKFQALKPIAKDQYEYYSQWYHPAIRELVTSKEFAGPEWLAQRLAPTVSPAQCAKSIQLLEKLGLIQKNGGGWVQSSPLISTGPVLSSVVVHHYHKAILELTKDVMDRTGMEAKDISTLTLGIRKDRMQGLIEKIREFRKEILTYVAADPSDEVVQLNIQLFPLTNGYLKKGN